MFAYFFPNKSKQLRLVSSIDNLKCQTIFNKKFIFSNFLIGQSLSSSFASGCICTSAVVEGHNIGDKYMFLVRKGLKRKLYTVAES